MSIEISRGCGNGCRFCVAGYGYRPYRERDPLRLAEIIDRAARETGFEEISLLSLSSGDYSCLYPLIDYIRRHHRTVSVSLPSLRIGSITEEEIDLLASGARGGLTFALEASTIDLRDRLNKDIETELLTDRLPLLKKHGWRRVKLYFMVGFPWEREEDLLAVRHLIAPFIRQGMEVNLSVSPFTPKAHTPFQWLPMEEESRLREKVHLVQKAAAGRGVKVKVRDLKTCVMEALISRGDGRLGPLFEALHGQRVRLEAWSECFNAGLYEEWLSDRDGLAAALLGRREPGATLPWDFVDTGVTKPFLLRELEKAEQKEKTENCYRSCAGCGLSCAAGKAGPGEKDADLPGARNAEAGAATEDGAGRAEPSFGAITLRYAKYGEARYLGHLDTVDVLLRALRSAGISLKMHGKYHPKPRVSLSPALPVGIESVCETVKIEAENLTEIDGARIKGINSHLPRGMRVTGAARGGMEAVAGDCGYLLVGKKGLAGGVVRIKDRGEKAFYRWHGTKVKELWLSGDFTRIVKVENRRIDGLRADHQRDL